jgi:oligopeptide transport system substrate-binding protein
MKGWSPCWPCWAVPASRPLMPPGTPLAAEQAVVRHLKDEPASLSPLKLVACRSCRSSETSTRGC